MCQWRKRGRSRSSCLPDQEGGLAPLNSSEACWRMGSKEERKKGNKGRSFWEKKSRSFRRRAARKRVKRLWLHEPRPGEREKAAAVNIRSRKLGGAWGDREKERGRAAHLRTTTKKERGEYDPEMRTLEKKPERRRSYRR